MATGGRARPPGRLHGWADVGDLKLHVKDLPVMDEAGVCKILCKALGKVVCDRESCECKVQELSEPQTREAGKTMVLEKTLLLRDRLDALRARVVGLQAELEKVSRGHRECHKKMAGCAQEGNWQRGMTKYLHQKYGRDWEPLVLKQLQRQSSAATVKKRQVVRLRYEQLVGQRARLRDELLDAKFHLKVLEESLLVMECFASVLVSMVQRELVKAGNTLVGAGRVLRGDITFSLLCEVRSFNCRL